MTRINKVTNTPTDNPQFTIFYANDDMMQFSLRGLDSLRETCPNILTLAGFFVGYTKIADVDAHSLDHAYFTMQGENWSPNGEARELLESLDIHHTSMSIGDIIHDNDSGIAYMVETRGFYEVPELSTPTDPEG